MTLDTLNATKITPPPERSSGDLLFVHLFESTIDDALRNEAHRRVLLQKVVELSTSDDSLDWDTLARMNIEGWGADEDSA